MMQRPVDPTDIDAHPIFMQPTLRKMQFWEPPAGARLRFLDPPPKFSNFLWVTTPPKDADASDCMICMVVKPRTTNSTLVSELQPVQHKKRRGQSEQYHRRVQKKWNKRAAAGDKRFLQAVEGVKVMQWSSKLGRILENLR